MSSPKPESHPIIIVTGANSGVGFATCQRLLEQLADPIPPDSLLRPESDSPEGPSPLCGTKRLTLILACRNSGRATKARKLLWNYMDEVVKKLKGRPRYDAHAEIFRKNLTIDTIPLDLASMESVFLFTEEANRRYPYISHLILNAALLPVIAVDYLRAIKDLLAEFAQTVTQPNFLIQAQGLESPDGLGMVFQSNVLGHFCLFRELEVMLLRNPTRDSRIEWTSSLDARAETYEKDNIQLLRGPTPYEGSKFQTDLICTALAHTEASKPLKDGEAKLLHMLVSPGICHTANTGPVLTSFLEMVKVLAFYIARLLGSQNHPIYPIMGAIALVYGVLAPLSILEASLGTTHLKLTSKATLFGRSYIGVVPISDWDEEHAKELVNYCDNLVQKFKRARPPPLMSPTSDSGIDTSL